MALIDACVLYAIPITTRQYGDQDRAAPLSLLAPNRPAEAGVIVPSTGGVRKVRWGIDSRGKRGGLRVMYYYHDDQMPIFLLTVFAKNEQDDISESEKRVMRQVIPLLLKEYHRRAPS